VLSVEFEKLRGKVQSDNLIVNAEEFISVKGFKAIGNQLSDKKNKKNNT
jgi:topoisomerase-4 subunit A